MESKDLDELLGQARAAGGALKTLYEDVTGEELDLESAVRHYPLLALGVAAGLGAAAGWWLGRKSQLQLPPPPPEQPKRRALEYVEEVLPGTVERVRARLPEIVLSDAAKAKAKTWLGSVVDRQLQQGVDRWAESADQRLGTFFRRATERLDREEEVRLEDPERPETDG
jgi:hypothetical protein